MTAIIIFAGMKLKPYHLLALLLFAACKKDNNNNTVKPTTPVTTNTQEVTVADSGSYTINGKVYRLNNIAQIQTGNSEADVKLDSVVSYSQYKESSSKDSIYFFHTYDLNGKGAQGLTLALFKKYSKYDMNKQFVYMPNNLTDIFTPGNYVFAVDYMRENATNGVAIQIAGIGSTYSTNPLVVPTTITADKEKNAHFEITKLTHVTGNQYILEAKFDATLFDDDENPTNVDNGYIRLNINIAY